jgi:uroporphyrinogen decarboxylase
MTSKERVDCVFSGTRPDRYPCYEDFWSETGEKWKSEGHIGDIDPVEYFDFDIAPVEGLDLSAQFPTELISEDETYKVVRDSRGVTAQRHKDESGHTPHWLDTPIKTPSDWWEYKKRLVFNEQRISEDMFSQVEKYRSQGRFVCLFDMEPYEQAWPVFGQVQIFMAMLENPEVVKDAMDTWSELTIQTLDYAFGRGLDVDGCFFYGDMGYRNGTLFGPDVYRALIMPAHKEIVGYLHGKGKKVILHSCGQIKSFIPMLIEVGFDALQPLEAKCDQDVRELEQQYGRKIVFFGNMDIRELEKDKESIRREVESKLAAFDGNWNYIFHSDHSVPQTVSYENYMYALELAKAYLAG